MTPDGLPLGMMVLSVRLFRVRADWGETRSRNCFPGSIDDGGLPRAVLESTGLSPGDLAYRFEGIGHDCEFGLLQRAFGAEPISLLRFTGMTTPHLVDGLVEGFEGIGTEENTRIYVHPSPPPTYRVTERRYHLFYGTNISPDDASPEAVRREQCRRLPFLRRKFLEDLREAKKIFVVSRGESLTGPEALAIWCALNMWGPNSLLWTVHGDASVTGQVDLLFQGFLRGQLGHVDANNDGTQDAWLSLLANAYLLASRSASARTLPPLPLTV
jgi:hypothetical protein